MNKIFFIIPVYKVEKYLKRCVDSVINQTYKNVHIVLVDDGSPDKCGEICDQYAKEHDFYHIKGGVIDGKVVSKEELITLAKLPSREVLLAKLAGSLLGNITKLAIALDQVQKQKTEA